MKVFSKIPEIKQEIKFLKNKKLTIGLVPTMGALHIGHESLVERAKQECDVIIVSIFVNPKQFGPNEDFDKYPRPLEADREICMKHGVDYIFAPSNSEMYPENQITMVVPPDEYQDRLCGKSRPGHFNGVATVVLKLFNIITPDRAYFGEKDAQQLAIIKKMVRDLDLNIDVIGCPIVRDADGLACSSRNRYLSESARQKALSLHKVLKTGDISQLHSDIEIEYFEKTELGDDKFLAIAARVNDVRLIDNIKLEGEQL